jgi:gag-polypeptide of LTR copia-type
MTVNDIESSGRKIPTLGKDNYSQWKRSIKCELTLRELWEVIEPDPASGLTGATTMRKKEAKAQAFIMIHLEERYQATVDDMNSAKEMWTFLERLFKARLKDRAVDLRREFFTSKQKTEELAMELVARVETRGRELRDACQQTVSD